MSVKRGGIKVALRPVWHGERFSWWMSNMLHDFGDEQVGAMDADLFDHFMSSERDYFLDSEKGRRVIAKQYVGLPFGEIEA